MAWNVEYTDEFGFWWGNLTEGEQEDVGACVQLLEARGANLGFPKSSDIKSSRHSKMRELRIQSGGKKIRVFYAFNPERTAILLIGGVKSDDHFYEEMVPIADNLYDVHLEELKKEQDNGR